MTSQFRLKICTEKNNKIGGNPNKNAKVFRKDVIKGVIKGEIKGDDTRV